MYQRKGIKKIRNGGYDFSEEEGSKRSEY